MTTVPIIVFAYAFPHRKTQDFLTNIFLETNYDVIVVASPCKKLPQNSRKIVPKTNIIRQPSLNTKDLCKKFGFKYYELKHDDTSAIADIVDKHNVCSALISGARILKNDVIDLFSCGVINFHPGPIPETSGLDSLYYTIKNSTYPGITVHYIDKRVDAGRLIGFYAIEMGEEDTFEIMGENLYQIQIIALRDILKQGVADKELATTPIDRPFKNNPLAYEEKLEIQQGFPEWRNKVYRKQKRFEDILSIVETGKLGDLEKLDLSEQEINISLNDKGWSALTVAAYNQRHDMVSYLIKRGGDVNYTNKNGTTVLMYAKTKLLHSDEDYSLLKFLIHKGANIKARDKFGKTIIDYVREHQDKRMEDFLLAAEKETVFQ